MGKGIFFVISGTDGSGKGTQCAILKETLQKHGYTVDVFDFPRYGNRSAKLVELYLNGVFGDAAGVPPKIASAFYAYDRYMASDDIRGSLEKGHIVLSNRYVSANMGHQGGKINDPEERLAFIQELYDLEFNQFGIPKPDMNIFLHVPHRIGQQLVLKKEARAYIKGKKQDIHEKDTNHLKAAEEAYLQMAATFDDWKKISCVYDPSDTENISNVKTKEEIAEEILAIVKKELDNRGIAPTK
jgi:dTMP kinase